MSESSGREKPQTRRRKSLSDKQLAILEVIQRSIARYGYPPSMREIGDAVGLSSLSSVTHQLNQLELSGYLRRDAGKTRAMEVLIDLPGMAAENPADNGPPQSASPSCHHQRTHATRDPVCSLKRRVTMQVGSKTYSRRADRPDGVARATAAALVRVKSGLRYRPRSLARAETKAGSRSGNVRET